MLLGTGTEIIHLQGALIETAEIERICDFIVAQRGYPSLLYLPEYNTGPTPPEFDPNTRDPLFEDCARLVVLHQQGSPSLIQRKLKLGYNRAGRIIDQLQAAGIVGPFEGSKAREVLFPDEYSLERFLSGSPPDKPSPNVAEEPIDETATRNFPPVITPELEIKPKGFWNKLFKNYFKS